ncbi:MAG TPA: hypothetical protein VL574_04750 [Stellaceae bacterium]|jgi:hypothetical protein|nr:hypothetical protein [Stellaceae bacterium]
MMAWWLPAIGAVAAYLFFAGQLSLHEVLLAWPVAALGLAQAIAMSRHGRHRAGRIIQWLAALWPGVVAVPRDTCRVGTVLAQAVHQPPTGPVGGMEKEPVSLRHTAAARRAQLMLSHSLAPNGIVVATDDQGLVLHRLRRRVLG